MVFGPVINTFWLIYAGVILLALAISYFLYSGGFFFEVDVKISHYPLKQAQVAYKYITTQSCKYKLLIEVEKLAPNLDTFIIYYRTCRELVSGYNKGYSIGALLQKNDKLHQEMCQNLVNQGFLLSSLPIVDYVVLASFPRVNNLSDSFANSRIFPKFHQFIEKKRLCAYPLMEVFTKEEILFMAPLSQQNSFYLPKAVNVHQLPQKVQPTKEVIVKNNLTNGLHIKPLPSSRITRLQLKLRKGQCHCDVLDRSQSCEYCKRAL